METPKIKTVKELVRTIEHEIQINGLWKEDSVGFAGLTQDGKLTVSSVLTQDRTSLHTSLVSAVEQLWEHVGLTTDPLISKKDTLTIINSIFKE